MKFEQLRQHNMKISFLEKSYTKYGEEIIPRPYEKHNII